MIAFLIRAIRIGMTFLFGCTGEIITEKSGHLNLGIPGIMCLGAACGCTAESIYTRTVGSENLNPVLVVLIPVLATFIGGALLGLLYSFLTVTLRANQNVTGLTLTTLGTGLSNFMIHQVTNESYAQTTKYFTAPLPFSDKLGWFGQLFFSYGSLVYLAVIIALIAAFVLSKTKVGLHLRAVGENPSTADAAGINVSAYRYGATMIGSGIAALGGFCYIMDNLNGNWEYTIDAIGWLSIALVIFALWKPVLALLGSILFGALYTLPSYTAVTGLTIDKSLGKMLPYLVTIIVLIAVSMRKKRENQPPASLGLNYFREER